MKPPPWEREPSDFELEWRRREELMPKAVRLRELGLSYEAIAKVMGEYHGLHYCGPTWRNHMVNRFGVPLKFKMRRPPRARRKAAVA